MYWLICTFFLSVSLALNNKICENQTYVYKQAGNVTVAALIGVHYGEGCSVERTKGFEIVESLISAIEAVRINNIISGLNIGLTVYDTCSQKDMAQKTIISALVDAECSDSFFLGAVMEEETEQQIKNLTASLGLLTFQLSTGMSEKIVSSLVVRVLYELHWIPVDKMFSTNKKMTDNFVNAASLLDICVKHQMKLNEMKKLAPSDTAVIFLEDSNITDVIMDAAADRLLIVPLDGQYQPQADTKIKSSKVLLILPTIAEKPVLLNPFNITEKDDQDYISDLTKSKLSMQQLQTMSDIMKLVGVLKAHLKAYCSQEEEWKLCSHLPKMQYQSLSNDLINDLSSIKFNLKLLRINPDEFEAAVVIEPTSVMKLGSLRILGNDWSLDIEANVTDDMKLCKPKPSDDATGYDCSDCSNYNLLYKGYFVEREYFFSAIKLKQEAWVAALLSISSVGILCCIAIIVFIIVRICKKDMLEGNPGFSFLLLFSIMFMYLSILPYSFETVKSSNYNNGVFCGLKIFGTSLSYALVFSTMLARSVMLASCDEDGGFMSHINGYLQTVMFFFIAAVQIALTIQFWAINWLLLSEQQCLDMSRGSLFLFLLGYDMLLLFLLLIISPFIMRSKRNYREGGYFSVSALLCLTVWLAWCAGYVFFPSWEDVFISSGLVATATVILVSVFIPRTYLMVTGIVRDHIVSSLPTLAHTASTSVIDVNYRSTQALYDSVTIPRGNGNPNYYSDRPTTPSTSKMEDDVLHENTYERYESSPSSHNITRF